MIGQNTFTTEIESFLICREIPANQNHLSASAEKTCSLYLSDMLDAMAGGARQIKTICPRRKLARCI